MNPTFSIVMPTLGRPDYVERAVTSVLRQTFSDFELLILDNTPLPSQDSIRRISESDPRIIFVERGNVGVTAARKMGAELSKGRLFALLDSDDYWGPTRLEKHVRAWKDRTVGLSWDRWVEVTQGAFREFTQPFRAGLIEPPKVAVKLYKRNFIHASSGIVSTSFARSLGFPFPSIMSSDWTLFMRAAEYYRSCFIDETLSFKELSAPDRITDTEGQAFFSWEIITVRRWLLVNRPKIYGLDYVRRKALKRLRMATKKNYN